MSPSVPKTITIISRMEVGAGWLAILDEAARRHGLTRDAYIAMTVTLYTVADEAVTKARSVSGSAPRDATDLLAYGVLALREGGGIS